jgi:hypothetical protein
MDQTLLPFVLIAAAVIGIVAALMILRRERHKTEAVARGESPFAVATEGMKRCPSCGMGNLVTDDTCAACGAHLPG